MDAPTTRPFTPARITALALIALMALGLGCLRFAPDGDSVSVPAGAKAGDLILEPCDYTTENGSYKADCGTLVVPENRTDPQSRLIALPVTRIRARSAHPAEPLFRLQGGPGKTNMQFKIASRFADDRDVVLVGYRGADGSSVLDCPEVESAVAHSTDVLSEKSFRVYGDELRACANRLTEDGVDLDGYSMTQQADDLEAARIALGYDKIDLVSESAGTRLAMIYSWRYPKNVHRSVMIAVNPPGHFWWEPKTTDKQIARYAELCAQDDSCSKRTDDLVASMRRTAADMPDRWLFLPIDDSNVRIASFFGLMETTSDVAPLNGPTTIDAWLSAAKGDPSGFWLMSLAGKLLFPKMIIWGEYAAVGVQDAWATDAYYEAGGDPGSILGNPLTNFAWGGGRMSDSWPVSPDDAQYRRVRKSNVDTLLIGGELDFSTPAQNATKELLPYLPNGKQVILRNFGHSDSFWADQPEAGTRLINTYLASGRVDTSAYTPAKVDFTPTVAGTTIAKIIAATLIGFALITVLSLVLMARRVRKRGGFGRKASATLRSIYPIVLGVGGWFLGLLIVLTTMPGVPLDEELLAALSVGLPIGLGVCLAWVNRDSSAKTKATGFAAAMSAALVGAWLGFNAAEDLAALLTTIAGATVGANLILVALDIAWDRQARARSVETLEPVPTIG